MPKGEPNKQTIATAKYQAKAGYVSKAFKIKKDVAEAFKEACERSGESQASAVTTFMRNYISEHKE